jgi:phosphonatase-like hydrolase
MPQFQLVVFDMAGTTVSDRGEVETSFLQAAHRTGLATSAEQLQPLRGLAKREVFRQLWAAELPADSPELSPRIEASYAAFRRVLERHYQTEPVEPTDGCLECFDWLRSEGIAIGLTTGFYRKVTDIILARLGWDAGLNERHIGTSRTVIQCSVTSDEVPHGRPAPDMIVRTMELLGVESARRVVNIGDTPPDLLTGRNAGCGLTLAVTNGSHTADQLRLHPHDGLLSSLHELQSFLNEHAA